MAHSLACPPSLSREWWSPILLGMVQRLIELFSCVLALLPVAARGEGPLLHPAEAARHKDFWQKDLGFAVNLPAGLVRGGPGADEHGVHGTLGTIAIAVDGLYSIEEDDDNDQQMSLARVAAGVCSGARLRTERTQLAGAAAVQVDCEETPQRCRHLVTQLFAPRQPQVDIYLTVCAPPSDWPRAEAIFLGLRKSFIFVRVPRPCSSEHAGMERTPP